MAIRFEYGPKPSALGNLAYQAGAAQAADQRRREVEALQVQAAQMAQQQEQAALDREFNAWRTQYDHYSSVDRAQRDHIWRNNFQEQDHNNALEMNKFQAAENRRAAGIANLRAMEKERQRQLQIGNNKAVEQMTTQMNAQETQVVNTFNREGMGVYRKAQQKHYKILTDPKLSPEERQKENARWASEWQGMAENKMYTQPLHPTDEGYTTSLPGTGMKTVREGDRDVTYVDPTQDSKFLEPTEERVRRKDGTEYRRITTKKFNTNGEYVGTETKFEEIRGGEGGSEEEVRDLLFDQVDEYKEVQDQGFQKTGRKTTGLKAKGQEILADLENDVADGNWPAREGGREFDPTRTEDRRELFKYYRERVQGRGSDEEDVGPARGPGAGILSTGGGEPPAQTVETPAEPADIPTPTEVKEPGDEATAPEFVPIKEAGDDAVEAGGISVWDFVSAPMQKYKEFSDAANERQATEEERAHIRTTAATQLEESLGMLANEMETQGITVTPQLSQSFRELVDVVRNGEQEPGQLVDIQTRMQASLNAAEMGKTTREVSDQLPKQGGGLWGFPQPGDAGGAPQGAQPATQPVTQAVTPEKKRGDKKKPAPKKDPWDDKKITQKESQDIMADPDKRTAMLYHRDREKMLKSAMKNDPALKKKVEGMFGIGATESLVMKILTTPADESVRVGFSKIPGEGLSEKDARQFYNLARKVRRG